MNCVDRFILQANERKNSTALWTPSEKDVSFAELHTRVTRVQASLRKLGVTRETPVLLAASPDSSLFATILACLGLGAPILLVEPWLSVERIDHIVKLMRPRVMVAGMIGKLWAMRARSARTIPHWVTPSHLLGGAASEFICEDLPETHQALIAFTSGTTGSSKGIVRTQRYLWDMHDILVRLTDRNDLKGPDLSIFANVALFHLGTGRGSVLVPSNWKLKGISDLPSQMQPESLSCGPAFLETLMKSNAAKCLKDIHVGGALTDISTFERAFSRWPDARVTHVYGGSEAEPVAHSDARDAVKRSRDSGYAQTLFVGTKADCTQTRIENDSIWVAGPNVCPEYLDAPEENRQVKKRDASGTLWHNMGDRLKESSEGYWYMGRTALPADDFMNEQKIHSQLGHTASFLWNAKDGRKLLIGRDVKRRLGAIQKIVNIDGAIDREPVRDRRHRARIDRIATAKKAGVS